MTAIPGVLDALGVQPHDCVAVVGAGGKTTLCWRIVQALAARGERVVFTTTTKIWRPAEGVFDAWRLLPRPAAIDWAGGDWRTLCLASAIDGEPSDAPVSGAIMPTVQTKWIGFAPADVCALRALPVMWDVAFVIEADGARGRLLKAPAEYEPAIPPCANVVCVVASLDAIGRPLDERSVHRAERVARITGVPMGSAITAAMLMDVLCHPEGGLKRMPANARRIAVLAQHGVPRIDVAPQLAQLRERGYHCAVVSNW